MKMERLTQRSINYCAEICRAQDCETYHGVRNDVCGDAAIYNRLASYEDTGLEPEEIKDAKRIAERIATADYPHNYQRERADIADYMRWITDVMREAKAWWNSRIRTRAEAEKAMEVMNG